MRANLDSPATRGVYGPNLGENFGAEDAPFIVTRTLQRGEIAVTEVCVDRPLGRLSDPIPRVDAYMIDLLLRDLPNNFLLGRRARGFGSIAPGGSDHHPRPEARTTSTDGQAHPLSSLLHPARDPQRVGGPNERTAHNRASLHTRRRHFRRDNEAYLPVAFACASRSRARQSAVHGSRHAGAGGSCRTNLWWNADDLETAQGRARSVAGKAV
jgi:hypothetical protein